MDGVDTLIVICFPVRRPISFMVAMSRGLAITMVRSRLLSFRGINILPWATVSVTSSIALMSAVALVRSTKGIPNCVEKALQISRSLTSPFSVSSSPSFFVQLCWVLRTSFICCSFTSPASMRMSPNLFTVFFR
ncbi:hypothetical protein MBAV_000924 [Candidatus Magnetobacterium bavaricum]|uniref:Uncharacterized protein n=1 Tax=Candidatus Magnetobacterium bavaricum TaxID=29290 RepID=A0A0F3GYD8_9BACT|nr:hypothetical protein MBAV_000924 [Candidatus Magnetobacterium bavaricum]